MSFLANIIVPKLIKNIEDELLKHEPELQQMAWNEVHTIATLLLSKIENKIKPQENH